MAAKQWPATLWPARLMFDIEGQSSSGGISESGYEQVVVASSGRITAQLLFKAINRTRPKEILAARSVKAHMRGRANTILIGPFDAPNGPAGLNGEPLGPFDTPHSDDTYFSDDTGYDQLPTPAHAQSATAMGGVQLRVVMESGHEPQPGQWFGLKDKEIYLISEADDFGGGVFLLTFGPTLRRDVVAGETVNFDWPTCEMRASADVWGQLAFERMFQADFQIELVEAAP